MDGSIHGGGTACSPNSREPGIPGLRPDLTGPFPTDTSSSARPGQRSLGVGRAGHISVLSSASGSGHRVRNGGSEGSG